MNEAVIGLIGIIIGFILSECSTFMRSRIERKRLQRSIRSIIGNEVSFNLGLLRHYASLIQDAKGCSEEELLEAFSHTFPGWIFEGWNSQLSLLPTILPPGEVHAIGLFYYGLRQFEKSPLQKVDELIQLGTTLINLYDRKLSYEKKSKGRTIFD